MVEWQAVLLLQKRQNGVAKQSVTNCNGLKSVTKCSQLFPNRKGLHAVVRKARKGQNQNHAGRNYKEGQKMA